MPEPCPCTTTSRETGLRCSSARRSGRRCELWDDRLARPRRRLPVVRFDTRGHGRSAVPAGPYSLGELADDVVAWRTSRCGPVRYVGLSLGGAIGQVLALDHRRAAHLAGPLQHRARVRGAGHLARAGDARSATDGLEALVGPTSERWFTESLPRGPRREAVEAVMAMFRATTPRPVRRLLRRAAGLRRHRPARRSAAPTRVVMGADDPGTPPPVGELLAAGSPAPTGRAAPTPPTSPTSPSPTTSGPSCTTTWPRRPPGATAR